jgi:rubrerythrin
MTPSLLAVNELLARRFLDQLLSTARGRAWVLWQASEAENDDEGRFFDLLLSRVDDAELHRMIRLHQSDENRHAQLYAECAERTGAPRPTIPAELKLIERLDRALGGFFANFEADRRSVMEAYLLLQVLEERAVTQFSALEPAFRRQGESRTADVIRQVASDEERHLKYCRAISRRYAPDEATHAAELRRFRAVEGRVFAEHSRATMRHALDSGLVRGSIAERLLWRGLLALGERRRGAVPTRFWQEAPGAAAA